MDTHFFAGLTKFKLDAGKLRRDDDFADRFSHTFTTLLLVVFTLVISARQYIGKPIACWVPTEFTRAQEEYAESVCWVTSTYFIPTADVSVPIQVADRENRKIHYYQWVPFILMIQAFLFNLPCIIWRLFNWQSGIHLSSIMEVACEIEMIKDPETRKTNVAYVARHIEDSLATQREYRTGCGVQCRHCLAKSCCLWFGKRYGNYLTCLYLIVKSLYILNVVGQFFFMNRILGSNYTFYGLDLLRDLAEGIVWQESGNFPRITLCDFEIRKLANIHRHTVQCVLPINMFNEKIFIFLWFWFILVAAVNSSSFFYWSYKSSFHSNRVYFVRKFLKLRNVLEPGEKKKSLAFVESYLRQDGVFILRLVSQNAGELVASEIIERMWIMYRHQQTISICKTSPHQFTTAESNNADQRQSQTNQRHSRHRHPSGSPGQGSSSCSSVGRHHEAVSPPIVHHRHKPGKQPTPPESPLPPPLPPSYRTLATAPSPMTPSSLPPIGFRELGNSLSVTSRNGTITSLDGSDRQSVRSRDTQPSIATTVIAKVGPTSAPPLPVKSSSLLINQMIPSTSAKVYRQLGTSISQKNSEEDQGEFV